MMRIDVGSTDVARRLLYSEFEQVLWDWTAPLLRLRRPAPQSEPCTGWTTLQYNVPVEEGNLHAQACGASRYLRRVLRRRGRADPVCWASSSVLAPTVLIEASSRPARSLPSGGGGDADRYVRGLLRTTDCRLSCCGRIRSIELRADSGNQTDDELRPVFPTVGPAARPINPAPERQHHPRRQHPGSGQTVHSFGQDDSLSPRSLRARDFIEVTNRVPPSLATLVYEASGHTLDLVWIPWFTPSRAPLPGSRWFPVQEIPDLPPLTFGAADFPGGSQLGARWSFVTDRYEFSLSIYDGFNHLPTVLPEIRVDPVRVELLRVYPNMRMYGGDVVIPVRADDQGEAGYSNANDGRMNMFGCHRSNDRPVSGCGWRLCCKVS